MFSIDLSGKVAWVTGGSRGIGKSIALSLAKAGCDVAIGYRSKAQEANEVVAQINAMGRKAACMQMDVSETASCEKAYAAVCSEIGKVDILVNNAGVIADNLFVMLEDADWKSVIDTNLMGVVHVTRCVVRDMMMKKWGRVINMSSVAGTKGGRGQSNYAATKGAIESMSRCLAGELCKKNVTVNCVAPGVIETDMSAEVRKLAESEILDRQLIKRFGKPDEIAAWVVFLASNFGDFITGQVIHVDGGLKMG
jgi:3-oxoacyl-[acyl-carrier protein] reductase